MTTKKPKVEKEKLTEQQRRFCEYYVELGVGVASAIKAGYSEKSARSRATKLLNTPHVREYIDKRMKSKNKEVIASQDEILGFLTKVMRGQIIEEVPLLMGEGFQDLIPLEVTPINARIKAGELLGKRSGMWTDKKEVTGSVGVTIVDDIPDDDE